MLIQNKNQFEYLFVKILRIFLFPWTSSFNFFLPWTFLKSIYNSNETIFFWISHKTDILIKSWPIELSTFVYKCHLFFNILHCLKKHIIQNIQKVNEMVLHLTVLAPLAKSAFAKCHIQIPQMKIFSKYLIHI